jgi:hypothetical protein
VSGRTTNSAEASDRRDTPRGDMIRGLGVWLGAALCGSFGTTAAGVLIWGAPWAGFWASTFWWGTATLLWTVGGSAALSLAFAWMSGRSFPAFARYCVLTILGPLLGIVMLPTGTPTAALLGLVYGGATTIAWIILHRLVYRGR